MLTKDLLRLRASGMYLRPQFLKTDDHELLQFAKELIAIYEEGIGEQAETLDNLAEMIVLRQKDLKLARGLLKVVRSRAVFSGENDDFPYAEKRQEVFARTMELLRNGALPEDPRAVRDRIYPDTRLLYGDLPENEALIRFKKTFPQEALERYNTGLVQGALLTAGALELSIPAATPAADLRNLFRSLRFFRLLFSGSIEKKTLKLVIDGPASILENSLKYGMQLACFFPAICRLPQWKLACSVMKNGKMYRLVLDESSRLQSHRAQFSGNLEEHRMFLAYFREHGEGWEIDDAPGYLSPDPQRVIFPDFQFTKDGRTCYLELFHRWHASALEERLANPPEDLIIGVDRSLLKKDGVLKAKLEADPFFQKCGFFFRDFPGTENVLKLLNK